MPEKVHQAWILADAYNKARRVGRRPELCAFDSHFSDYYANCNDCIDDFIGNVEDVRAAHTDLGWALHSYIGYCATALQQLPVEDTSSQTFATSTSSTIQAEVPSRMAGSDQTPSSPPLPPYTHD
ncbi:hypothetical protein QBC38DRAFT_450165 [Podospora fimiseda]|uniref:Uncharacterized protein n=1 Tax=Podospora fimiseda TaxID=252190 RepID=A0AAN7BZJ3_9PEZI|nr:hypothetical protein QBC38DRAFT_450165 [Podospora fimiseda]